MWPKPFSTAVWIGATDLSADISAFYHAIPVLSTYSEVHDIYLVGGAVRDMLLSNSPLDYDIVVSGDPQVFVDAVSQDMGVSFFKLGKNRQVVYRGKIGSYTLDIVPMAGGSIASDLYLRDFTINAMAVHLGHQVPIDPLNGQADLAERTIRMVSEQAFVNDPLRLIRAYRLAATLNFEIETETKTAIQTHSRLISKPAGERIREELFRLLNTPCASGILRKMKDSGLLFEIFPEIRNTSGCTQNEHHTFDVLEHTLWACHHLEAILNGDGADAVMFQAAIAAPKWPVLKLAMLLHDIGKPSTRTMDDSGSVHFYGHEKAGAQMASDIALRLKLSNSDSEYLRELIRNHLRPLFLYQAHQTRTLTRKGIVRLFRAMKDDMPDLLAMVLADIRAKTDKSDDADPAFCDFVVNLLKLYGEDYLPRQKQAPLITGQDLMIHFGLQPSAEFKIILEAVEEGRLSHELSDREMALAWVQEWLAVHEKGAMNSEKD